ncbi:LLM class flavin-dependent oxidoreductase [Actinoplanes sp. Pm04-4]|uniref:LLM class flavin-dependent oxidoreductase n=1 Tax=Paractinoplanes pyxinae TaxID=2997416 RepID=A0ABT4BA78_9ACTN|nr:LLM class flavin-dependent oxidoreductase [Actinoplanes pyxinae]MCY1143424.1 LLM class flavin-dependent oxidoreductase [Actinoplanes pyxinae]
MGLNYAVGLPTVGEFGDVRRLVGMGVAAERSGWDGVHLWDHLLYHDPSWPVTNSVVAASAIAAATERVRIILTIVLPRRQVQDVAQETLALDELSGGRLTVVPIIGSVDREFSDFGLDADMRARGRALDERLAGLKELWAAWGGRQIPIWCGGLWPNRAGLRRAARFDGAMPIYQHQRERNVSIDEFRATVAFVRGEMAGRGSADATVEGRGEIASQGGADPTAKGRGEMASQGGTASAAEGRGEMAGERGTEATALSRGRIAERGGADATAEWRGEMAGLGSAGTGRGSSQPNMFDFVLEGATEAATAADQTAAYSAAGLTWWIEALGYWRGGVAFAGKRISHGPVDSGS